MPESAGTLYVDVAVDTAKLKASLESVGTAANNMGQQFNNVTSSMSARLKKVSDSFNKVGKAMTTYVTLPILAAGAASIKFASDYEESLNKVNVAFGGSAQSVIDWSNTTLKSIGLAKGTALDMAAGIGDMATSMGFAKDAAADMGKELVGRAADLASFKNISIDVANTALKGIFTGETESLKTLGVVMTQANLQAFALSKGIQGNIQDMSESEKVALRYSFVLEKTGNAQGDFARTSDGAANQMRIFKESLKELSINFGAIILPIFTKFVTKLNEVIQWFGNLSEGAKKTIIVFAGVLAVVGPLLIIIGKIVAAVRIMIPVMATLNAVFAANPIGLIVIAIGVLVTALIFLVKNFDVVKAKISVFWTQFKFYALQAFMIVSAGILKFAEYFLKAFEIINAPIFIMLNKMIEAFNKITGKNIPTLTAVFSKATTALNAMSQEQINSFNKAAIEHEEATKKEIAAEKNKTKELEKEVEAENKLLDKNVKDTKKSLAEKMELRKGAVDGFNSLIESNSAAEQTASQAEKSRYAQSLQNVNIFLSQKVLTEKEAITYREELEKEHNRKMMEIRQEAFNNALNIASQLTSQTSAIFDQYYTNRSITLDNNQLKEEEAIKKSALTEDQKQAELDKISAKYDKKRKKLQRDQAKQQKVMSIFNATIATAQAVTGALGNFPWSPANIALAAIMGALGAAQIGLIASQPLPELATGGLTTGATQAIIGEAGQEAVIPLTNQSSLDAIASALAPALAARLAIYNQPQSTTVIQQQGQLNSGNNNEFYRVVGTMDINTPAIQKALNNGELLVPANRVVNI